MNFINILAEQNKVCIKKSMTHVLICIVSNIYSKQYSIVGKCCNFANVSTHVACCSQDKERKSSWEKILSTLVEKFAN